MQRKNSASFMDLLYQVRRYCEDSKADVEVYSNTILSKIGYKTTTSDGEEIIWQVPISLLGDISELTTAGMVTHEVRKRLTKKLVEFGIAEEKLSEDKQTITIQVTGKAGTGKSRISAIIARALLEHQLEVDYEGIDHENVDELMDWSGKKESSFPESMHFIQDRTRFVIEERQKPRQKKLSDSELKSLREQIDLARKDSDFSVIGD